MVTLYIDSCAVNRFAEIDLDPIDDLEGTEFEFAYTPDLKAEYEQAIARPDLCPKVRRLLTKLLGAGRFFGFDGPPFSGLDEGVWASRQQITVIDSITTTARAHKPIPKNRTDAHLVGMAQDEFVITDNFCDKHWHGPLSGQGRVIFWSKLKGALDQENNLAKAISKFLS
jgi:hypothetical protein